MYTRFREPIDLESPNSPGNCDGDDKSQGDRHNRPRIGLSCHAYPLILLSFLRVRPLSLFLILLSYPFFLGIPVDSVFTGKEFRSLLVGASDNHHLWSFVSPCHGRHQKGDRW